MSEAKAIADALLTRLTAFSGIAADRIAWPHIAFTPPDDGLYVEVSFHALEPEPHNIGLGTPSRREGWLQMTVVGRKGDGVITVLDMAGQLADHFPAGATYQSGDIKVRIARTPGPETPFDDEGLIRCSVKARYFAIA